MTTATLLERIFSQTSDGARMTAEAEANRRAERTRLAARLDHANATAATARLPLIKSRDAAARELTSAEAALSAAKSRQHATIAALSQFDYEAEIARNRGERALLDCAGDDFRAFMDKTTAERERLTDVRRIETEPELVTVGYSIATGPDRRLGARLNTAELGARVARLAQIERLAERLAATKADFSEDLKSLWASLPSEHLKEVGR